MQVDVSVLIALVSVAWSVGIFVGLFTAKFVSKKECKANHDYMWENIDSLKNVMAGGRMTFELRMVKQES